MHQVEDCVFYWIRYNIRLCIWGEGMHYVSHIIRTCFTVEKACCYRYSLLPLFLIDSTYFLRDSPSFLRNFIMS